jgi:hypothetical protein
LVNRWPAKVNSVVYDQQRVWCLHDILIDGHTVQVLLEKRFEEHVLFFQLFFLLIDGEFVEVDFVVAFEEVLEGRVLVKGFLRVQHFLDFRFGLLDGLGLIAIELE